ncbi:MAG: ABC transporter substrate-binding protein [Thalassobaculaceae bacterium]|nr:ABC transporter substrate-binding protein [Thalassobaculaceae bacterium]
MAVRALLYRFSVVLGLMLGTAPALALEITDITGRQVHLDRPADRILLGEGRLVAALGVLDLRDPLTRVAGMLDEFKRLDPLGYAAYQTAFPEIDAIPTFGQAAADSVSIEAAVALKPDAAIFGVLSHGPNAKSDVIIDALNAAGIPVIFVDFRQQPLANTAQSIRIIGQLLGLEESAEAFASFHEAEVARVTDRLAGTDPTRPTVLLEAHVGLREECCFSIAKGSLADLMEAAGARNLAAEILPGAVGMVNLEAVLAAEPDIYIGTAIGTPQTAAKGRIALGAGVSTEIAASSLATAMDRPGVAGLRAVRDGRVFGIWHHFYNSPLNAYALQRFAKWFHPELFADLDPEATLAAMLARFRPVDLSGAYATGVVPGKP